MAQGTVTGDRKVVMPLKLRGNDGSPVSLDAIVDTGFDGYLTLPNDVLRMSHAEEASTWLVELGDGSFVEMNSYLVDVNWLGSNRRVVALESASEPLLGMSMLWESRVCFDAVGGGVLSVVALQS